MRSSCYCTESTSEEAFEASVSGSRCVRYGSTRTSILAQRHSHHEILVHARHFFRTFSRRRWRCSMPAWESYKTANDGVMLIGQRHQFPILFREDVIPISLFLQRKSREMKASKLPKWILQEKGPFLLGPVGHSPSGSSRFVKSRYHQTLRSRLIHLPKVGF